MNKQGNGQGHRAPRSVACARNGDVEAPLRAGERLLHGRRGGGRRGEWLPSHVGFIYGIVWDTPTDGCTSCAHGNLCHYAAKKELCVCILP